MEESRRLVITSSIGEQQTCYHNRLFAVKKEDAKEEK